jgi:hypothetical protein
LILDSICLTGSWLVSFEERAGGPEQDQQMQLSSWTKHKNDNIKYYSGTAIYKKSFRIPAEIPWTSHPVYLELGNVREIASLYINGKEAGILWKPPYEMDINSYLVPGDNNLEIHVVNTWTNRLIGDMRQPEEERQTWVNCCLPLNKHSALMKSGLLGPVKLVAYRQ